MHTKEERQPFKRPGSMSNEVVKKHYKKRPKDGGRVWRREREKNWDVGTDFTAYTVK